MSLSKRFPLLILASVCWSLECLISALTEGGSGGHVFRLTCSVVLWGERNSAKKHPGLCVRTGSAHSDSAALGLPRSLRVWFRGLHCSGSRSLCRELNVAGPGLSALPRSKPLRFGFSGTPQRRRFSWGLRFVPVPGPSSSGDQVLGERSRPQLETASYRLPHASAPFLGIQWGAAFQVCCVSLLGN